MRALILAGGEGTRLRPLTLTRPKPALRLVDRPFIQYMVDWVAKHGIDEVVIACGFGAGAVREALGSNRGRGLRIDFVEEPEPLGTAGPLRLAAEEGLLGERFLVLNGDVLADLDLTALIRSHEAERAVATVALYPVDDPSSYGLVRRAGGPEAPGVAPASPFGEILGFLEKPAAEEIDTDEVNAGAYVIERGLLDLIPGGRPVSIEREVFPRLVGQGLYGHRLEGYWMDIGTPERYLRATWDILEGFCATEVGARLGGVGLLIDEGSQVDPGASVQPPALLEADVVVEHDATVGSRAVIAPGVEIGAGATVSSSVVLEETRIGPHAFVHDAIVGPGVVVGEGARLGPGVVVGENARIEPGVEITDGARLAPGEVVS